MDQVRKTTTERLDEVARQMEDLALLVDQEKGNASNVAAILVKAEAAQKWVEKALAVLGD